MFETCRKLQTLRIPLPGYQSVLAAKHHPLLREVYFECFRAECEELKDLLVEEEEEEVVDDDDDDEAEEEEEEEEPEDLNDEKKTKLRPWPGLKKVLASCNLRRVEFLGALTPTILKELPDRRYISLSMEGVKAPRNSRENRNTNSEDDPDPLLPCPAAT
eukprot:scaffold47_cov172-Ochromonas_danica.AAC.15